MQKKLETVEPHQQTVSYPKTKILFLLLLVVFLVILFVTHRRQAGPDNSDLISTKILNSDLIGHNNLKVIGDISCKENTRSALELLKNGVPRYYDRVIRYIGTIECIVSGSVVYPWQNPPLFRVGKETVNAGTFWYASVLVHEACHIELYSKGLTWKGEVPEKTCLEMQYSFLVKVGADKGLLDYTRDIINSEWWKNAPEGSWY